MISHSQIITTRNGVAFSWVIIKKYRAPACVCIFLLFMESISIPNPHEEVWIKPVSDSVSSIVIIQSSTSVGSAPTRMSLQYMF